MADMSMKRCSTLRLTHKSKPGSDATPNAHSGRGQKDKTRALASSWAGGKLAPLVEVLAGRPRVPERGGPWSSRRALPWPSRVWASRRPRSPYPRVSASPSASPIAHGYGSSVHVCPWADGRREGSVYNNGYFSAIRTKNLAICDHMDEPRGHCAE